MDKQRVLALIDKSLHGAYHMDMLLRIISDGLELKDIPDFEKWRSIHYGVIETFTDRIAEVYLDTQKKHVLSPTWEAFLEHLEQAAKVMREFSGDAKAYFSETDNLETEK